MCVRTILKLDVTIASVPACCIEMVNFFLQLVSHVILFTQHNVAASSTVFSLCSPYFTNLNGEHVSYYSNIIHY